MRSFLLSSVALGLFLLVLSVPLAAQTVSDGGKNQNPITANSASGYGARGYGTISASDPWIASVATCTDTWACPLSTPRPMPATPINDDPECFLPPVAGIHSPTVSLTRLEVPQRAKQKLEKACSALKHKEFSQAEEHLLKALDYYPEYAGAWVLLGQVQELEHKTNDAAQSCSRAHEIDASYAPAYLCLAYLLTADKKWEQLRQLTERLLQLHPIYATNVYYYHALANLNLGNLPAAEISARRGIADGNEHHQPHLHLVLSQVYERAGNRRSEIDELHEYLRCSPRGNDVEHVNNLLRTIEDLAPAAKP